METWRKWDARITRATELAMIFVGALVTLLVSLEVFSRYVFDFSIYVINALSTFLLVWFFLLGATLATKYGAHIGFEILLHKLPRRAARIVEWIGHCYVFIFLGLVLIGCIEAMPIAMEQLEPALDISVFWSFLSIPVGFGLMLYHYVNAILYRHYLGLAKPPMPY